MRHDGAELGFPFVDYSGTTAAIEALADVSAGATAYSTDDLVNGFYNGTSWVWGLRLIGSGWALDGGGNARGVGAIDLQTTRNADTQVASGDGSIIVGGSYNTASSINCIVIGGTNNIASANYVGYGGCVVVGGSNNTASSDYGNATIVGGSNNTASNFRSTIVGGDSNTASGVGSFIGGGQSNTASGFYSIISGGDSNISSGHKSVIGGGSANTCSGNYSGILSGKDGKADKFAQQTQSSTKFQVLGDAQRSTLVSLKKTANNTPTELFLNNDAERVTIASDTTWMFEIHVVARRIDADNESAAYHFMGCIDNNAGTTALVGSVTKTTVAEDTAGWDCNVTADDANDALIITATGENAKTIQWVATIFLTETTG